MSKEKDTSTGRKVTQRAAAREPWVYKEKKMWTQDSKSPFWDHPSPASGAGASTPGSSFWLADDMQYNVGTVKGRGAFATVFRAQERESKRVFAVKRYYHADQVNVRKTAREESRILESMRDGPHILQTGTPRRDEMNEIIELPMEYYHSDLMSLMQVTKSERGLIKDSILVPDYYHEVLTQVLEALEYLHSKIGMIVHRDVHPKNILWKERGKFVLAGFSLARIIPPPIGEHNERRSFPYLAPEVYEDGQESFSSDIWSLGIVCLDMLHLIPKLEVEHHALPFRLWQRVKWCGTMTDLARRADRPEVAMMVLEKAGERATAGEVLRYAKSSSMNLSRQYQPSVGLLVFLFREDRNSSHLSNEAVREFAESYLQNPRPLPSPPSGWQRAPPRGIDITPEDVDKFAVARSILLTAGDSLSVPDLDAPLELRMLATASLAAQRPAFQQPELYAGLQEPTGVVIDIDEGAGPSREGPSGILSSEAGLFSLLAAQSIPVLQPNVPSRGVASQPPTTEVQESPPAVPRLGQSKAAGSKSAQSQPEVKESEIRSSPRARAPVSGQSREEKAPPSRSPETLSPRGGDPAESQSPPARQLLPRSQEQDSRLQQTSVKASAPVVSQPQSKKAQARRSSSPEDAKPQGRQASSVPAGSSGSQTKQREAKTEQEPSSPPHKAQDRGPAGHADPQAGTSKAPAERHLPQPRPPPKGKLSLDATRSKPGPSQPETQSSRKKQLGEDSVSAATSASQKIESERAGTTQNRGGNGEVEPKEVRRLEMQAMEHTKLFKPGRAHAEDITRRESSSSPRGHFSGPPMPRSQGVRPPQQQQQKRQQQAYQGGRGERLVPPGRLAPQAQPVANQQQQQQPAQQQEDEAGAEWKQIRTRTRRGSRAGRGRL